MDGEKAKIRRLEKAAWDPYDRIEHPTAEDWRKSYDALKELCGLDPEDGRYPNTLGYLCYYGRHTGGKRQYREARAWFRRGAKLRMIESTYKLADMLADGLGGPADPDRALRLYAEMYLYCLDQFESGVLESKFADTALRMGRIFHEGKIVEKDNMEALSYLLEARYAIDWRKQYGHYGDGTVESNIEKMISECDTPPEEMRKRDQFALGLGMVPSKFLRSAEDRMTIDIEVDDLGVARLEFRRKDTNGKKKRILWPVTPAMRCFLTDFVVLYGAGIRKIWTKEPGEQILCDRHEYDEANDEFIFFLNGEPQCRLRGGEYVLPMDEFWKTEVRDHPEAAGNGVQ